MEKTTHEHEVPIVIDRTHFKVFSPASGSALYSLGGIGTGYDLFRESRGSGDDEFIPKDEMPVPLHPGDHFYSAQSSLNPGAR